MKRKENSMLPYDLVLIDTPGFQRDDEVETETLKRRFKVLFESGRIPGLHAICFVNQSHSGRLTSTERSLSETLIEICGHNVAKNTFVFATCADSPYSMFTRILNSIKFKYHKCFKFSNTPFTMEHQMSRSIDQENNWEKGKKEIFDFFNILTRVHLSSFQSFIEDAKLCEQFKLEYYAKREEISNACYDLINIMNKEIQYDTIKQLSSDGTYSTICNRCKRNCCHPCFASWVYKRLCWNIYFFSGKCHSCGDKCKVIYHEYGKNTFIRAPRYVSKPSGASSKVDVDVLKTEQGKIRSNGLNLLSLLVEATGLQNKLQTLTKIGEKYSVIDIIDSFIKEKSSIQSLDWKLFVVIFEKCKRELTKQNVDRWANLQDLEAHSTKEK